MKRIYRYEITGDMSTLHLRKGAIIRSIAWWKGEVSLWVEIDTNETEDEEIAIYAFGTGHDMIGSATDENLNFIGTVLMPEDMLVFHFFWAKTN